MSAAVEPWFVVAVIASAPSCQFAPSRTAQAVETHLPSSCVAQTHRLYGRTDRSALCPCEDLPVARRLPPPAVRLRCVVHPGLTGHHRGDDPTGPHAARVDVEVVEVVAGIGVDAALLGLEHHLVLEEDARHALPHPVRDGLLVYAPVARERPEVVAGAVGPGGHGVDDHAVDALAAVTLRRTGTGLGHAHVDRDRRGRGVVDDLPAVD